MTNGRMRSALIVVELIVIYALLVVAIALTVVYEVTARTNASHNSILTTPTSTLDLIFWSGFAGVAANVAAIIIAIVQAFQRRSRSGWIHLGVTVVVLVLCLFVG